MTMTAAEVLWLAVSTKTKEPKPRDWAKGKVSMGCCNASSTWPMALAGNSWASVSSSV